MPSIRGGNSPGIPKFQCFVPRSGHQACVIRAFDPMTCLYRCIVLSDLYHLIRTQIPALHLFVTRRNEYFCAILRDTTVFKLISNNCENVIQLTSAQHTSSTGPPIVFICFGTVLPLASTSQQRTLESQLPAIRKFCGIVAGLNSMAVTLSSGGDATSISFIGFTEAVGAAPNALCVPIWGEPNIFACEWSIRSCFVAKMASVNRIEMWTKWIRVPEKINSGRLNLKINQMSQIHAAAFSSMHNEFSSHFECVQID